MVVSSLLLYVWSGTKCRFAALEVHNFKLDRYMLAALAQRSFGELSLVQSRRVLYGGNVFCYCILTVKQSAYPKTRYTTCTVGSRIR